MSCCGAQSALDGCEEISKGNLNSVAEEGLLSASHDRGDGTFQTDFTVPDMHCIACINTIERGLGKLDFVRQARANLSLKRVSVIWERDRGTASQIDAELDRLGFEHMPFDLEDAASADNETSRRLLLSLAVAGFAAANIMLLSVSVWSGAHGATAQLFHLVSGLIAAPAVFYAGQPFFKSAAASLRGGRLNMDVPISLAVLLAFFMSLYQALSGADESYFDACVTLLFFLLIGRYLDHRMRDTARNAVIRLAQYTAKGASRVLEDGTLAFLPASEIEPGMVLRLAAGERAPVDGKVASGNADIDRSLVTGESDPVAVRKGDAIEAGVLNLTGVVDIIAEQRAENSFLAEVMSMMDAAEQGRGAYVRVADRLAQLYAPAVHLLALIAFVGWMFATGGDWKLSLFTAIAVLIVTCPCALGLAVPVVHVIGAGRLFGAGILMKDGSALERLAEADRALFDKTGTLTTGEPGVAEDAKLDERDGRIALALASHSRHPASLAIARFLRQSRQLSPLAVDGVTELPGHGMQAMVNGKTVRLGRPQWVAEIASKSQNGRKAAGIAFAMDGKPSRQFRLNETLRPDARQTVQAFARDGMAPEIVSGDSENAVAGIAEATGALAHLSELTPAGKIDRLAELRDAGHKTFMVGDGLNDAPALAAAHVSMAPATASDVGRLAADFVFTRDSLSSAAFARDIAKRSARLIRQNFGIAIVYNCIAVPLAMAGFVTPLVAAIAMSGSSIVVVANSMRLNFGNGSLSHKMMEKASANRPQNTEPARREAMA